MTTWEYIDMYTTSCVALADIVEAMLDDPGLRVEAESALEAAGVRREDLRSALIHGHGKEMPTPMDVWNEVTSQLSPSDVDRVVLVGGEWKVRDARSDGGVDRLT